MFSYGSQPPGGSTPYVVLALTAPHWFAIPDTQGYIVDLQYRKAGFRNADAWADTECARGTGTANGG